MNRKIFSSLVSWKNNENKKPLLITGSRGVGKTYLVKEFGKLFYKNIIYVNFEKNEFVHNIFNDSIDPSYIIKNLEILFNERIDEESSLIIFDEIEFNKRAVTSLKYFYDDRKDYNIIALGSLIGNLNKNEYQLLTGKVDILKMYPLSFEEFLNNTNNENLVEKITESYAMNIKLPDLLHKKALSLFYDYISLGGMPNVIDDYLRTNSIISSIEYQKDALESYKNDINKYNDTGESNKILSSYDSIYRELIKDNRKFQYKLIRKGATNKQYKDSIDWLVEMSYVNKCVKADIYNKTEIREDNDSFKLYLNDVGLLTNLSKFPIYLIKDPEIINDRLLKMLIENYVANTFDSNNIKLNYWKNNFESEIEFIIKSSRGNIVPVEIKTDLGKKTRSMNNFMIEYNSTIGIRISENNFKLENNIKNIPYYAVFCITKDNIDK